MLHRPMMDLTHFTPTTLAAMAADLEQAERLTRGQRDMLSAITAELIAIVGSAESRAMVEAVTQ